MKKRLKSILLGLAVLLLAGMVWLPSLHLLFARPVSSFYGPTGVSPRARELAARHIQLWADPRLREQELGRMRVSNAEWDFMGRSYLVWALANLGLRDPASKPVCLQTMDRIIDETLLLEKQNGICFFLMPYAKDRPYVVRPARSLFLDGEIALMLASRRVLEEKPEYKPLLTDRVNLIVNGLQRSRRLGLESYPDECWTFDHVVALAAIRTTDYLDGGDHSRLIRDWVAMAKKRLVHPASGLLVSTYALDDTPLIGPEGSSLWMVAHCLQWVDEDFARDQYERTRRELGRTTLGFSYAREWPDSSDRGRSRPHADQLRRRHEFSANRHAPPHATEAAPLDGPNLYRRDHRRRLCVALYRPEIRAAEHPDRAVFPECGFLSQIQRSVRHCAPDGIRRFCL